MPMIIDQIGLPSGVPGRARRDGLSNGAAVMLTDNTPGGATVFELLWVPDGDISSVSSLEVTTDPRVWTFTPTAGVTGPYRILLRHTGAGEVTEEIRIFGVADENDRVPPAPGERADPTVTLRNAADPALIAKCERNWPTSQFPAGNPLGWYADVFLSSASGSSALRIEADWCLTAVPAHETSEDGNHLTGNSESGDLLVDSAPYGKPDTYGRFQVGQLVLVPFDGTVEGLYRVNQDSDDGWELEKIPLSLPVNAELEIRIKYGAQWGGCTFLTNQAQLSWGPNFRIQPQPILPYPVLSAPLNCTDTIAGGYPHGYQNNYLLVGKLNLIDATLAGGESLLYVLAPDNSDAILGCSFGVKILVGNATPLTITCASGSSIEAVDGLSDSNAVTVPATAGTVVEWIMTPGGVWRVLRLAVEEAAQPTSGGGGTGAVYVSLTSDFDLASLNAGQGGQIAPLAVSLTHGHTWHIHLFMIYHSIDSGNPNNLVFTRAPLLSVSEVQRVLLASRMDYFTTSGNDVARTGFDRFSVNSLTCISGMQPGSGDFLIEVEGSYYSDMSDATLTPNFSRGGGTMGVVRAGSFFRVEKMS